MMDPYNLAICFGPSLLPIPEDKNPVQYQPLVNELIKGLIVYQVMYGIRSRRDNDLFRHIVA